LKVTDKSYAVLTGDLVKSSRLTAAMSKTAMDRLKKLAIEFGEIYPGSLIGRMDTFRHDSWQVLLDHPALAFRAAVFLRSALKMESDADTKYDTRVSIGVGGVELVSKRRISDSRGDAFVYSGKGLDVMANQRLALINGEDSSVLWRMLKHGVIPLLDGIVSDWTPPEARAVYGSLKGWTQEETAGSWPPRSDTGKRPTRQAVGDSLLRAHWGEVDSALHRIESEVTQALGLA